MKYVIEGGALPVVRVFLEPGETMISEAGGRTWAKGELVTESSSEGGAKKALGRMFSGESLFMSKYTAQGAAEITFASSFPGKILAVELGEGRSIVAQRKVFMCAHTVSRFPRSSKRNWARAWPAERDSSCKGLRVPGSSFWKLTAIALNMIFSPANAWCSIPAYSP